MNGAILTEKLKFRKMRYRTDGGKIMKRSRLGYVAVAWLLILALGGCNEYRVETTVRDDGGGARKMVFVMDPGQDELAEIDEEDYALMFGIGPNSKWKMQTPDDKKKSFKFESEIAGVDDWSKLDGSISVRGTLEKNDYAGVFFTNSVSLETGSTPAGSSYTYREGFRWTGLIEAAVDFQADAYARRMKEDFPHLDDEAIAELRGVMAGHLLVGVRFLDIWNDGDEELPRIAHSAGKAAEAIVRKAGRKVAIEHVYELARIYVGDEDSVLEGFLEKNLPGAVFASLTDVKIRLVMPGKVVETNGRIMDDGAVEWKMDLLEALGNEIVFHARSESK
jgi:hypothetical protein